MNRNFGRVNVQLVVLRNLRRFVENESIFFEGIVERLAHTGAFDSEAFSVRRRLVIWDWNLERLVQKSPNDFLL